ncbi:DUF262 domain-containing protein [Crocosphaera sp. XPORK-15E]|uniref:DUF262 domain-containing protein n=1 Tax=Crocosphaera sp. XPORK-15E TaxID=3110247 RepID=UPI002B20A3BB|nr:DUF262 domain-containing protein [Crocosphaera sp. XPORK-15E]MEA5533052.1 DUF262 domain-containing protein [Crocosphaera sp. XPORK-15E]
MQASQTKLQDILDNTRQYIIPLFQRPYSWKKSEWQTLWDDILELYTTDSPRIHFMGSIVTSQIPSVPQAVTKYSLIDGQQRLTTIVILFCALRDYAKKAEEQRLAEEINDKMLVNKFSEGIDYYKLQPTQADRQVFQNIINNEENLSNYSDILECYIFFDKQLRKNRINTRKIKQIIGNNLSFISILLSADDDPYLVFESLNAKGRPLTQADLIRNYFFMKIKTDKQESVYQQYWLPMQDSLGDNLTEFIRHYLTKSGNVVKQNDVYFVIKEQINNKEALLYLQDLVKFSKYYAKLLDPNLEQQEQVRKCLHRINRLDIATVYPFLLNYYDEWTQNQITQQDFIDVLKIIENFILRRFVCNIQTQGLNRIFASLYLQIIKDIDLASQTLVDRLKLVLQTQGYPKDNEFREGLIQVKLYGGNRSEKAKIILESIEESFNHKEQVSFDNLSIEHIMPQKLTDWWQQHLGEDWEITHELLIHSLGNLTLTASEYNSSISNHNFSDKQKQFNNSHLELNKYFGNQETWKREDIEKRAEYLADIALKIWNYFGDESMKIIQPSSVTGKTPKLLNMLGTEYHVKSWRDVLEITLNTIADFEPDSFKDIMEQFPRFVGLDDKNFRDTRKLKNGAFIEVNLPAKSIYAFCLKAIETAELSQEEWDVETILRT